LRACALASGSFCVSATLLGLFLERGFLVLGRLVALVGNYFLDWRGARGVAGPAARFFTDAEFPSDDDGAAAQFIFSWCGADSHQQIATTCAGAHLFAAFGEDRAICGLT
jgi:hypothetical protein